MNEDVAQHFVILYYFRDGSYWSCCETRPIFNLVDTRCNRIVTAWRPFGTFHQQRFCYSVSVAWDHPLQSASLEIIGLSLCHQIYPLDPLPFYPFLSFSFGLLVCSVPQELEQNLCVRGAVVLASCTGHSGQAHCHKQLLHKSGVFAFWNVLTDPIALHLISPVSALCSSARLQHQVSSDETIQLTGTSFISQFRTQRCTQFWMKKIEEFIWIIY